MCISQPLWSSALGAGPVAGYAQVSGPTVFLRFLLIPLSPLISTSSFKNSLSISSVLPRHGPFTGVWLACHGHILNENFSSLSGPQMSTALQLGVELGSPFLLQARVLTALLLCE